MGTLPALAGIGRPTHRPRRAGAVAIVIAVATLALLVIRARLAYGAGR